MHIDPDLLALLALGEDVASPGDRDHLAESAACRDELQNYARTAAVGRSTLDTGDLVEPAPRVWSRISDELQLGQAAAPAPVVELRPRRRLLTPLLAAAAVLVVASGGLVAWTALRPAPSTILASATLDPFPGWAGASGTAVVEEGPQGGRVVKVDVTEPDGDDGYREVWLIASDSSGLVSLGVVRGDRGTFTIPDGIDLSQYDLVDVSAEPFDGDPAHSGDSIVRGQLN